MGKTKETGTTSGMKSVHSKLGAHSKTKSHHSSHRKSKRSSRSRRVEKTQTSDIEAPLIKSDKTQKSLSNSFHTEMTQASKTAPPDNDKFDDLKKDAMQVRKTQIQTKEKQIKSPKAKSHAASPNASEFVFDKTQWELTKWGEDAKKNEDILPVKPLNGADVAVKSALAPPKTALASDVPGENRQTAGEQGDYLHDRPLMSLIMNAVEIVLAVLAIMFSLVASRFLVFGIYVTTINLALGIAGATFILIWQLRRGEVGEEETAQKTKRYFVKGLFKKIYFDLHYWRAVAYFCCFVIFLYHGSCADERAGFRTYGFCRSTSYAMAMYLIASVLSFLAMVPPITHLVFIYRKVFAIVEPCR
uniref:Transmembrane protein n=1 Tax=Panagrellus redivivus TaxID=6233 RepID=A0A7E4VTP2_PANRE